jgi:hypothetical protein
MHLGYLIYVVTALATISAHPGQAGTQARSESDLQVRQPLNAFHGSHRFVDSSVNAKRSSKKHRRGNVEAPKKREGKRKVKKRSGTCVAKTTSTASLGSTPTAVSSAAKSDGYSKQTPSPSSAVKSSSSSVSPSATPIVQGGFVDNGASASAHTSSVRPSSATLTSPSSSKAASSTSSSAAAATSSTSSWSSPDTEGNGPFSGEITYYDLGSDGSAIGACGTSLVDSDKVSKPTYSIEIDTNIR